MTTNSEFDNEKFIDAYPLGIESNFWSIARNEILSRALDEAAREGLRSKDGRILEIGCGTGVVIQGLRNKGHDAWGVELSSPPYIVAGASEHVTTSTRAEDLSLSVRGSIETILLLDVIEHIENDSEFIRNILSALPACQCVIVTVPARPEVWSAWDDYYGHYRRYTPASLKKTLELAGLTSSQPQYFFHALYIAAWLMKKAGRKRDVSLKTPSMLFVHRIIATSLVVEHLSLRNLPARGLSLLALARPKAGKV